MNICIKDIYQIILSLIVLYLFYSRIYEEKFQNTTTGYQADVEAIRNLSSIATKLMSGGLSIPGNLLLSSGTIIDLGSNDTTREPNAGKIGYNVFGDALSIVGKGKVGESRQINLFDSVNIMGYLRTNGPTNSVPTIIVLTSGSNINWIIPSGVFRCKVTCIGAGGGGSGGVKNGKGGGGGGGGLCIKVFNNLTPGDNATYTIGVGGVGGFGGPYWGAAGGNTSFTWSGITITANGGSCQLISATNANEHSPSAGGGDGINGDINIKGGGGSCGQPTNFGTTSLMGMSNGGNSPLGYGFGGVDPVSNISLAANGNNGTGYGGGGSGGYAVVFGVNAKGGNGSNGAIIIEY
jgi:hypothetical protein